MDAVGGGSDLDLEGARFHDPLHPGIDQRELLHGNFQLHAGGSAGGNVNFLESFQLLHRRCYRADQVTHIELHDLLAVAVAGIGHLDFDPDPVPGGRIFLLVQRDGIIAGFCLDGFCLVAGEIAVVRAVLQAVAGAQRPVGGHGEQVAELGSPAGAARAHEGESGDGRVVCAVARRRTFDMAGDRTDVDHPERGQDAGRAAGRRMGDEVFLGIPVIRVIVAAGGDQGVHIVYGINPGRSATEKQQDRCQQRNEPMKKCFCIIMLVSGKSGMDEDSGIILSYTKIRFFSESRSQERYDPSC